MANWGIGFLAHCSEPFSKALNVGDVSSVPLLPFIHIKKLFKISSNFWLLEIFSSIKDFKLVLKESEPYPGVTKLYFQC